MGIREFIMRWSGGNYHIRWEFYNFITNIDNSKNRNVGPSSKSNNNYNEMIRKIIVLTTIMMS